MKTKAVILASGVGRRLAPLTDETPKPLIMVRGVSILDRTIRSLADNKITSIIITTGHLEKKIKEFLRNKYKEIDITYIKNPLYDKTNYIYSLWLVREAIKNNNVVLLHGDLIYDQELMRKIVKESKSCVLVKRKGKIPKKDFKARVKNGLVTEIGVNLLGCDIKFCAPMYKFLEKDFKKFMNQIGKFVKEGIVNCYAEDALNKISTEIKLFPVYYDNEFCMEIDDFNDLEKAKMIFKNE